MEAYMSTTYLKKSLREVAEEVKLHLLSEGVTPEEIAQYRTNADKNGFDYPIGTTFRDVDELWLDYEVQRVALPKHIHKTIMAQYDHRVHAPAQACKIQEDDRYDPDQVLVYDGQQRSIAATLLGYDKVPCIVVETKDPAFPSYAFEQLNETGVKKLTPGDLHKNCLTRHKLGSREPKNVLAHTLQYQFDQNLIDLEDKGTRNSDRSGGKDYFFSHFNYAYKGINVDTKGKVLNDILNAIQTVFPRQEEIDQGVFIGLYELARLDLQSKPELYEASPNWMIEVLQFAKKSFSSSEKLHKKTKEQLQHIMPGASWDAPRYMSAMLRELYEANGGEELNLPSHGKGSGLQLKTNSIPSIKLVS
jgi:hypothetical protein